ncbi:hypothetical protein O181_009562 [Austropuccinia psidii MF-1]|uniref:Uncharacterized protein n=1 Tax=Austropuccinia psidii MF-1 TaxID=1389203 RepID=A0A9Q3BS06_9BASI|nr:hypothetical protein [Austropuccinia psidii MF-1]
MDICNSKNRYITIGKSKDNKFSFEINHILSDKILKDLLEDLKEAQCRAQLTGNMKLNLLKVLRKHREDFAIGNEPLGKIEVHDIELYLIAERSYPPMLRRPSYPSSLDTKKDTEKHINELL